MKQIILVFIGLFGLQHIACAQESRIDRSTITIPNSTRSVMNLKVTDRIYSPMKSYGQSVSTPLDVKLKESVWAIDSLPKIDAPASQEMRVDDKSKTAYGEKFKNALLVGLGNYGHTLFDFNVSQSAKENKFLGLYLRHDANQFGPVMSEYSARSENLARLESRSLGRVNYWESTLEYKMFSNYYYGLAEIPTYVKASDLLASYTRMSATGKLSSAQKSPTSDYLLSIQADQLTNAKELNERLIQGHGVYAHGMSEKLRFKLVGDYIYSEYSPSATLQKWNRSLYRLNPHLAYKSSRVSLNAGFMFITESEEPNVEKTSVYPMLQMDFGASDYIHLFGGVGGDVQFNSFHGFLKQNSWMMIPSQLKNTNQVGHVYGGIKGIGGNKVIDFEAQYDYAEYSDLPFFVNAVSSSNKFDVQYRGGLEKVQVTTYSAKLNFNFSSQFTSSFKFNQVIYEQLGMKFNAPHMPETTLSWINSWRVSPKILFAPDVYWIQKLYALEPVKNQLIKLDDILDVNLKINYFIKRNLNIGLSGNNLLGKNYQKYYQYKVQGLNATLTLAYSF